MYATGGPSLAWPTCLRAKRGLRARNIGALNKARFSTGIPASSACDTLHAVHALSVSVDGSTGSDQKGPLASKPNPVGPFLPGSRNLGYYVTIALCSPYIQPYAALRHSLRPGLSATSS